MNIDSHTSIENIRHIRHVMDKSAKFLSLSGWSGVWAGTVALIGTAMVYKPIIQYKEIVNSGFNDSQSQIVLLNLETKIFIVAILVFVVALIGTALFTYRNVQKTGEVFFNTASKKLLISLSIHLFTGAVFCFVFYQNGDFRYIVPTMLLVYGLSLINCSKYTFTDIRYLGLCDAVLACISMFFPQHALWFWALGFGVLHIFYGLLMWNKYKL